MSAFPNFMTIIWLLISLVFAAIQITSSVILLRERNLGPWLMLTGAVISLAGQVASHVFVFSFNTGGRFVASSSLANLMTVASGVAAFGSLLFLGGLFFFALTRRGLAARIAELEAILAERHNQRIQ